MNERATIETRSFDESFLDVTSKSPKLNQREYLNSGLYPVIDQGQRSIAGYTNETQLLTSDRLPLIVFGDHTRRFKFVTEPFVVGADGVKLLKTLPGLDPRYAFHFLRSLQLPDAGYARHYKFLREVRVPSPALSEQRRIAAILDEAGLVLCQRRQAILENELLRQSLFRDLFGDLHWTNETPVLEDFVDPARPLTYGILMPGPDMPGGVPYVRVTDMVDNEIRTDSVRRTTVEIANAYSRSLLRSGDLLFSIRGHVGRTAVAPPFLDGANITQDTARLALKGIDTTFVEGWLNTPRLREWLRKHTKGVAVTGINLGDVRRIPIPAPPLGLQKTYADRISSVRSIQNLNRAAETASGELQSALQFLAFKGEL